MENLLVENALFYSREGLSVIPIDAISKKPLIEWKEYQTKRADEARIKVWWGTWPTAGIGIVTGAISGLTVVDTEAGANLALFGLNDINTPTVKTGGGGRHFYFAYHEGTKNAVRFAPLYDLRSDAGYVIAPPSGHKSGNTYEWTVPWGIVKPMPFPFLILEALRKERGGTPTDWKHKLEETINAGERNQTATSVCGKLMLRFPEHEWESQAWPLLVAWNAEHALPPLSNNELKTIFISIGGAEKRRRKSGATIGEPVITEENGNYAVSIPITDGAAVFAFEDIVQSRGDIEAICHCIIETVVSGEIKPQRMFSQRLNIVSGSSRDSYHRALSSSFGKDIPWALVLSTACTALQRKLAEETNELALTDIMPETTTYLLHPYIEENAPNILFGKGGTGKTYLVLRMAVSLATGFPFIDEPCERIVNTLFIDYEATSGTFAHRVNLLLSGFDIPIPDHTLSRFTYLSARGIPIHDLIKRIERIIAKKFIGLVIIDSAALACGGQPEDADVAIRFFNALTKLKITTLIIAHETKAENKQYVFGSVFFHNSARNIWNAQLDREPESNEMTVGLYHRKSNNGRLLNGRGARIVFEEGATRVIRGSTEAFTSEETNGQKILRLLRERGWTTAKEIEDILGITGARVVLHRLKIKNFVIEVNEKWDVVR